MSTSESQEVTMTMKLRAINFHKRAEAAIDELAQITGLTVAEMVRRALDEYLQKEFTKLNRKLPNVKEDI